MQRRKAKLHRMSKRIQLKMLIQVKRRNLKIINPKTKSLRKSNQQKRNLKKRNLKRSKPKKTQKISQIK